MADAPKKYTLADHCLINAATEIGMARMRSHAVMQDALATFKDVLPTVTRENRLIGPLADACEQLAKHYRPKQSSAELTAAWFDLANALEKIHRWKHAQAMRAWQQQEGKTK